MPQDAKSPAGSAARPGFRVRSFPDRAAMGRAAGADVAAHLRDLLAAQAGVRMVFAAAPSQAEALAALVAAPGIDWGRVTAFHMDEYVGLPPGAPQRFAAWLDTRLFGKVPFGAVRRIVPEPDAEAAAADYAALLAEAPIDAVVLGIGVNGHVAFNDPPVADFRDPHAVKIVELDAVCRRQQVDDGCFAHVAAVPTHALTLTVPRLMDAARLFCVVPGPAKRAAVTATLHGPIETACPASILRLHPDCTLYLDADSTPEARP
ncbi:MAG: 6-phosphogluconolactonase [Rhodospirillales bacterium]|jgi:glucosamine-6-phosphate deaminase